MGDQTMSWNQRFSHDWFTMLFALCLSSAVCAGYLPGQQALEKGAALRHSAAEPVAVDDLLRCDRLVLVRYRLGRPRRDGRPGLGPPRPVLRVRHRRVQLAYLVGAASRYPPDSAQEERRLHYQIPARPPRRRMGVSLNSILLLLFFFLFFFFYLPPLYWICPSA